VGLAKESPEAMEDIKEKNFSEEMQQTELIMLRGAFDLEKLSFSDRMMMKALKRKILLKDPKTLNEEELGIL
jgi:menaquinone-dependent protoporphyrinogen IX oxidase